VETGGVVSGRAERRGGSGERGWSASGWEGDRIAGVRLTIVCDYLLSTHPGGQVEAHVDRRRERRRRCTAVARVWREDTLAERDRLGLGLGSGAPAFDSGLCGSPRDTKQRELQGAVREPGQEQVAGAEDHRS
jgi:hypothetical protein